MNNSLKSQQIQKINNLLINQRKQLSKLNIFEEDQDLPIRPIQVKNKHSKYLNKINHDAQLMPSKEKVAQRSENQNRPGFIRRSRVNILQNNLETNSKEATSMIPIKDDKLKLKQNKSNTVEKKLIQKDLESNINFETNKKYENKYISQSYCVKNRTNSILNFHYKTVKQFFNRLPKVHSQTRPQEIYQLLSPLYKQHQINITLPLIKQYKNCIYYGESINQQKYQGFLYFYEVRKVYYGQMSNQKKNGYGTQIDILNDVVYIGNFNNGKKKGEFKVIKKNQVYCGELKKNQYEGVGELTTDSSVYRGQFKNGERDGEGEQYFPSSHLTICGTFIKNSFTNNCQQNQQSRLKKTKSHMQSSNAKTKTKWTNNLMNPETNEIIFQPYLHRNYHEYNYELKEDNQFGENKHRPVSFRLKQVKKTKTKQKQNTKRKSSFSEQMPLEQSKVRRL